MYDENNLPKIREKNREKITTLKKTKGPAKADPLVLTNPLNSYTKLQIAATVQNNFLAVCKKNRLPGLFYNVLTNLLFIL